LYCTKLTYIIDDRILSVIENISISWYIYKIMLFRTSMRYSFTIVK